MNGSVQPIIENHVGAEVFINSISVGTESNFQNISVINKGAKLVGIVAYTTNQLAASPSGRPLISPAAAASIVVSFFDANEEVIKEIPYNRLISAINGGIITLTDIIPNLTKCKVKIVAAVNMVTGTSCYFSLIYQKIKR